MAKATTIKDAIKKWEEKHPGMSIAEAAEVGFQFQFPPIEKMDNSLAVLANCQKLSLSTNMIEKIAGISSLKNLKILSLARNYIKNLSGLVHLDTLKNIGDFYRILYIFKEGVADTLEQLWISYNFIEKVKGIGMLKKLKVLYMSQNLVKEWSEFNKLQELPVLEDLLFLGNPLQENMDEAVWKAEAAKRLPGLKKLDGEAVLRDEAD